MDNLVLARVEIELARDLPGGRLEELRQESEDRFRLNFGSGHGTESLVVSLRPELPWIGRPSRRWEGPRWSPDPFVVAARQALGGRRLASVVKPSADRAVVLAFDEGPSLVVELASHGANLVLLAPDGTIVEALRHPRSGLERLTPGKTYEGRRLPAGRLDPWGAPAAEIDAFIDASTRAGEPVLETLRRHVFGVGRVAAELVVAEAHATGRTPGSILRDRLDELRRGDGEIGIVAPEPLWEAVEEGRFSEASFHLLPWRIANAVEDGAWITARGAAAAAGLYYEAVDAAAVLAGHLAGLAAIVRTELRKTRDASERARAGLRSFEDPDRFRRQGEALLAGLAVARRHAGTAFVPDPYDATGAEIAIEAPGDRSLAEVADALFRRLRRARRGLASTEDRLRQLQGREAGLEELAAKGAATRSRAGATELEGAMRRLGLAVGLAGPTRAARAAAGARGPQVSGVRMFTSEEGLTILVGRSGRDNDRLTFKIAGPDDLWLHAAGVPGAHVVIRVPDKRTEVAGETLRAAAGWAAWFSDARGASAVDVAWTRRRNVRRARGAPAGQVVLKRSETLRVRPTPPPREDGSDVVEGK